MTDQAKPIVEMHEHYGVSRLYECGKCAMCEVMHWHDVAGHVCTLYAVDHQGKGVPWDPNWTACGEFEEAK
jgi:hypothetical protein